MVQNRTGAPWVLLSALLVIGAVAASIAFWLVDHRTVVRNSEVVIAILVLIFFVCWTWALMRYLRWRDRRRGVLVGSTMYQEELAGTVYGLIPGAEYRVVQSFTDYYGNQFQQGEFLRFKQRHFLPYHGGHRLFSSRSRCICRRLKTRSSCRIFRITLNELSGDADRLTLLRDRVEPDFTAVGCEAFYNS
jgi:hypothetical protein